ncbi:hypothetical protein Tco_1323306, partial [Tanacetum coccineum]
NLKVAIKQKKKSTTPIPPPNDDKERDEIIESTLPILALHKTAKIAEEQENVAKFADSAFLNDDDDSGNRIEPGSHKENPEMVDDDDENEKEKKDDKKDDDEKKDDVKDKDNDDHTDHTLVRTQATGSLETRKEKMQTPIPSPTRSLGKTYLRIRQSLRNLRILYHLHPTLHLKIVQDLLPLTPRSYQEALQKTWQNQETSEDYIYNEMIKEAVPRLVDLAIKRDREIAPTNIHMQNIVLNLYPTTSSSTATTSTADIQHQLYLIMKANLQDQATDLE